MTLRELREQNGKSRAEVAAALWVTVQAVARYESGERWLKPEQILLLSNLYDESAEPARKRGLAERQAYERGRDFLPREKEGGNEMKGMDVADRLREMWEENDNVMARLLEIKQDIETNGEFGLPEKNKLLDLKIECEGLAYEFGKILGGVL